MKISLIVAMSENRVIGINNEIPWRLSADLRNFKKITLGKPILMGRKTFESIGRPLPGRKNIIISRNPAFKQEDCFVYQSIDSAIAACEQEYDEIMIIGGASFYQALLPKAHRLYLTRIHSAFAGDTFFPEFDPAQWQQIDRQNINDDPSVPFDYSFIVLERRHWPKPEK